MTSTVELEIGGMTCASCASRIERKLNPIDGGVASVNYATATAHGELAPLARRRAFVSMGRSPAYTATANGSTEESTSFGVRAAVSAPLAAVVLLLAMVGPLRFAGWEWVTLALAAIVVGWGGWPFH